MIPIDTNKVILSGTIDSLEFNKTTTNKSVVNFSVSIESKYRDSLPCQAYGELADLIEQHYPIGTHVMAVGRLRSVGLKDNSRNWIVIEKIGTELI